MSLGHFEKFDAEAVLHELRSGGRSNGKVALWGRSMGAATALMCTAKLDPLVSCVIADSAFASLPMLVHDLLDEKGRVGARRRCVEINQCVGFFTKSSRGDDAAVLARSSGEEPASFAIEQASRRWRGGRRGDERAVKF